MGSFLVGPALLLDASALACFSTGSIGSRRDVLDVLVASASLLMGMFSGCAFTAINPATLPLALTRPTVLGPLLLGAKIAFKRAAALDGSALWKENTQCIVNTEL